MLTPDEGSPAGSALDRAGTLSRPAAACASTAAWNCAGVVTAAVDRDDQVAALEPFSAASLSDRPGDHDTARDGGRLSARAISAVSGCSVQAQRRGSGVRQRPACSRHCAVRAEPAAQLSSSVGRWPTVTCTVWRRAVADDLDRNARADGRVGDEVGNGLVGFTSRPFTLRMTSPCWIAGAGCGIAGLDRAHDLAAILRQAERLSDILVHRLRPTPR
jgi:hypothetical protein